MCKTFSVLAGLAAIAAASIAIPAFSRVDVAPLAKSDRADADIRCELRDWPRHKDGCLQFHPNFDEPLTPTLVVIDEAFAWPAIAPDGTATEIMPEAPASWSMSDGEARLFLTASETILGARS